MILLTCPRCHKADDDCQCWPLVSCGKGGMQRFSFQHSTSLCEICGKPRNRVRAEGRHDRCSKIRQRMRNNA